MSDPAVRMGAGSKPQHPDDRAAPRQLPCRRPRLDRERHNVVEARRPQRGDAVVPRLGSVDRELVVVVNDNLRAVAKPEVVLERGRRAEEPLDHGRQLVHARRRDLRRVCYAASMALCKDMDTRYATCRDAMACYGVSLALSGNTRKIGGGEEHLFHTPDPRASCDARGRPLGARASRGQNARDARDRTLGARASREQNAREILGRPL